MSNDDTGIDVNKLLFLMSSLSPKARDGLENESFRFTAEWDESTTQYILADVFKKLLDDLSEIGLTLGDDLGDYISDHGKLTKFVHLLQYLLPNGLYPMLKVQESLRTMIEQILHGSLGDGTSVIETYLTELGGLDGSPALVPELAEFIEGITTHFIQSDIFSDYLTNLIELNHEENPIPLVDGERHDAYRDALRKFIGVMTDGINLFENEIGFNQLQDLTVFVIRDFSLPVNFIEYAYLLLESPGTLPEELHQGYERKWQYYELSHPWGFEYHKLRGNVEQIPLEYRRLIGAFLLARSELNSAKFESLMSNMRHWYPKDAADYAILAALCVE